MHGCEKRNCITQNKKVWSGVYFKESTCILLIQNTWQQKNVGFKVQNKYTVHDLNMKNESSSLEVFLKSNTTVFVCR